MSDITLERIERLIGRQDERIRLAEQQIHGMQVYWRVLGAGVGFVLTAALSVALALLARGA